MFNLLRIEASSVRFWVPYQAKETRCLKVDNVAIADPYCMHENNVRSKKCRVIIREYLVREMLAHKDKDHLLVPYYPM